MSKQYFTLGFIFDTTLDKVLLIKKNRGPKNVNMLGKLNGVGGHLKDKEPPLSGMQRECFEETGLKIDNWTEFCRLNAQFGYVYCFYVVTDDISNYKQIENEPLNIYDTSDEWGLGYGFYQEFDRMANLDWLIPMALNHYKKLDSTRLFTVIENGY